MTTNYKLANTYTLNEIGRKLDQIDDNYNSYQNVLKDGEVLVGHFMGCFYRLGINIAPVITDIKIYESFMKQYRDGTLTYCNFYAIPSNKIE